MSFGPYSEEFEKEMEAFEAKYGFSLWWISGGYFSVKWQDVFDYYSAKLPKILHGVDYAVEGKGISNEGYALLSSGMTVDGKTNPLLAIDDTILIAIEKKAAYLQEELGIMSSLAASNEKYGSAILATHKALAQRYNTVVTLIFSAAQKSIASGIPLAGDYYGLTTAETGDYPIYTVVEAASMVEFATLALEIEQALLDIEDTLKTGTSTGVIEAEQRKGGAWKWWLAGGLLLTTIGIVAITVTAKPKRIEAHT